jgi:two-component system OmpR family response regulator
VKRVLIADDEAHLRLLVTAALRSEQIELLEAANGEEAWRVMQESRPGLALLDAQMPGRTGLEVTHAIRPTMLWGARPLSC